jgi:hypothetical protein
MPVYPRNDNRLGQDKPGDPGGTKIKRRKKAAVKKSGPDKFKAALKKAIGAKAAGRYIRAQERRKAAKMAAPEGEKTK